MRTMIPLAREGWIMNKQFEDRIREFTPPIHLNEMKKEAHLAVLKERMRVREIQGRRRHRRFRRQGLIPVVLMLMMVGWGDTELGSDDFEPDIFYSPEVGQRVAVTGIREVIINIDEDMTVAEVEELNHQLAARTGVPVEMYAFSLGGKASWHIGFEYQVGDKKETRWERVLDRPNGLNRKHYEFSQTSEWKEFNNSVTTGQLAPSELTVETLDGIEFEVRVYHYQSEKFGSIIYMEGRPTHPQYYNDSLLE